MLSGGCFPHRSSWECMLSCIVAITESENSRSEHVWLSEGSAVLRPLLCEAQGDGGGPAISCRLSGERQIGREDRRKIDMMFVEPPAANLACEIAMSRAA